MKRDFHIGRLDLGLGTSCLSSKYKLIVYDTETTGEYLCECWHG